LYLSEQGEERALCASLYLSEQGEREGRTQGGRCIPGGVYTGWYMSGVYLGVYHRVVHERCIPRGVPWWVSWWVYLGCTMVGIPGWISPYIPGYTRVDTSYMPSLCTTWVYHPAYTPLYTPGYTTVLVLSPLVVHATADVAVQRSPGL